MEFGLPFDRAAMLWVGDAQLSPISLLGTLRRLKLQNCLYLMLPSPSPLGIRAQ